MGYFDKGLFDFLVELKANNDRDWFNANKTRYERDVKEPFLDFISDASPALRKISRSIVADPRPVGGSLFRIYRDTRFAKDKTPYKTHAGAHFQAGGKGVHGPGYYLHL
ncbi:MAG: TIGR02453 family protein, partial [Polyangiales bacterium]